MEHHRLNHSRQPHGVHPVTVGSLAHIIQVDAVELHRSWRAWELDSSRQPQGYNIKVNLGLCRDNGKEKWKLLLLASNNDLVNQPALGPARNCVGSNSGEAGQDCNNPMRQPPDRIVTQVNDLAHKVKGKQCLDHEAGTIEIFFTPVARADCATMTDTP